MLNSFFKSDYNLFEIAIVWREIILYPENWICLVGAQRRAPLTNFNDRGGGGGPTEVHILYPKKITTSEFVYPKKSLLFLAYPKKSLSPFFVTQKISASLVDPKNHFWPKFQTQKITLTPPPPSLKHVSGAPGAGGGGAIVTSILTLFHFYWITYIFVQVQLTSLISNLLVLNFTLSWTINPISLGIGPNYLCYACTGHGLSWIGLSQIPAFLELFFPLVKNYPVYLEQLSHKSCSLR